MLGTKVGPPITVEKDQLAYPVWVAHGIGNGDWCAAGHSVQRYRVALSMCINDRLQIGYQIVKLQRWNAPV